MENKNQKKRRSVSHAKNVVVAFWIIIIPQRELMERLFIPALNVARQSRKVDNKGVDN